MKDNFNLERVKKILIGMLLVFAFVLVAPIDVHAGSNQDLVKRLERKSFEREKKIRNQAGDSKCEEYLRFIKDNLDRTATNKYQLVLTLYNYENCSTKALKNIWEED